MATKIEIGDRVKAEFDEGEWYEGTVTDSKGMRAKVEFDDGDEDWFSKTELVKLGNKATPGHIQALNNQTVPKISRAIFDAAAPVLKAMGVELKMKNTRYTPQYASVHFEYSLKATESVNGVQMDKEAHHFTKYADMHGLKPEMLGKSFTVRGQRFTIIGLNIRARKKPVLLKTDDGKRYFCSTNYVMNNLKNA